jgi:DNA-binding LacI/PurR family transcriptional regulator
MSIVKIAKAAGVSTATVSRVLNGSNKVTEETSKLVIEIANKLNYRPDHVARRMRVKSIDSLLIGLVITDISNPFFSDLARGVEETAFKHKHVMIICITDEDSEKERFFLNSMLSEKVSGLIIVPTNNKKFFQQLVAGGVPIVMVDRYQDNLRIDTVTINNELGAYKAVKRLIELGHKNIGIINGIKGLSNTEERYSGYKKALAEAGIPINNQYVTNGNFAEDGGAKCTATLLSLTHPPSAIFTCNNLMTLGCVKELSRRNLKIPSDVALIGFDDAPWAEALQPSLTTVRQPGYELGVTATETLIKRLSNNDTNTMNIVLNPELVVRASCGKERNDLN